MPMTVDDAQLLRMAAEPPRDAARLLSRARSFGPLIALLMMAPPVIVATVAPFQFETAVWGIRSLAVLHSESLEDVLAPGSGWRSDDVIYLPPLQAWLTEVFLGLFPTGSVAGLLAIPALAVMGGSWMVYRWVRDAADPPMGLGATVLLAVNPLWLRLTSNGSADALTMSLLLITAWGLWEHWRLSTSRVSLRLLCAGVAWGLAALAGGIVAVAFLIPVVLWAFVLGPGFPRIPADPTSRVSTGMKSAVYILFATGGALGGWWFAYMLDRYGFAVLPSWLMLGPPGDSDIRSATASRFWMEFTNWLLTASFLTGLWFLGVWDGVARLLKRDATSSQQLPGFMVVWLTVGLALRLLPGLLPLAATPMSRTWESFCVVPATYLAAHGLLQMTRRKFSTQMVLTALTLTVGCVTWMWSGHWQVALTVGGSVGALLAASAPLAIGLRRNSLAWSETEIRRWIQGFAVAAVTGHAFMGAGQLWQPARSRAIFESIRYRLSRSPAPNQVSLVTSELADDPAQLEYLVRALYPHAAVSRAVGWDSELTKTIVQESDAPRSRMLVVEWSRRELKLQADVGTGWQVTPVVESVPYRGRRLAVSRIEPVPPL